MSVPPFDPPIGPPHLAFHFVLFHPLCFLSSPFPFFPQVQLDIRNGHAQTVDKVLRWLDDGER
jgi:hypothetical protein